MSVYGRFVRLVALLVVLSPVTAMAADGRLRDLSAGTLEIDSGTGNVLAGDRVVYSTTRRVFGWPVAGGEAQPLARVPKAIGPADNQLIFGTGYRRIAAAQAGRVALIRDGGADFLPIFERKFGKQLRVGPPEGPLVDPTGCGEAAGGPVSLDGDSIAYRAAPTRHPCATAAVNGDAVVIRDLADGNRLEAVVPLPAELRAVQRVELAGPFVAFSGRAKPSGSLRHLLIVFDTRSGREVLRLPKAFRLWALDADGTLAAATLPGLRCRDAELRLHAPGDPTGRRLAGKPCDGFFDLEAGVLRFAQRRGHAFQTVELDVATGARRVLATTAGTPFDGDADHLVVDDPTCRVADVRVIALGSGPALPDETRRCLEAVHVPRTVHAGGRIPVRVGCPRGCHVTVSGRTAGDPPIPFSDSFDPLRSTTLEVGPGYPPLERGQRVRLRVTSREPTSGRRSRTFRVRIE